MFLNFLKVMKMVVKIRSKYLEMYKISIVLQSIGISYT